MHSDLLSEYSDPQPHYSILQIVFQTFLFMEVGIYPEYQYSPVHLFPNGNFITNTSNAYNTEAVSNLSDCVCADNWSYEMLITYLYKYTPNR